MKEFSTSLQVIRTAIFLVCLNFSCLELNFFWATEAQSVSMTKANPGKYQPVPNLWIWVPKFERSFFQIFGLSVLHVAPQTHTLFLARQKLAAFSLPAP